MIYYFIMIFPLPFCSIVWFATALQLALKAPPNSALRRKRFKWVKISIIPVLLSIVVVIFFVSIFTGAITLMWGVFMSDKTFRWTMMLTVILGYAITIAHVIYASNAYKNASIIYFMTKEWWWLYEAFQTDNVNHSRHRPVCIV